LTEIHINKKLQEITPYTNNIKEHPQEHINQIKSSIVEFGFNDPIAVDENNVIIEGMEDMKL
jgi:ParB-like chromosome segregation protein Spo0J